MAMSPKWAKNATAVAMSLIVLGFFGSVIVRAMEKHEANINEEPVKAEESEPDWIPVGSRLYKLIDKSNNVVCYRYYGNAQISCVVSPVAAR